MDTTKRRTAVLAPLIIAAISVALSACTDRPKDGAPAGDVHAQQTINSQLASYRAAATQTAQTYQAMDNQTLLSKLVEQSTAQHEPFNSLAYRELRGRKDVDPNALATTIHDMHNGSALLPLLLLRQLNRASYLALPAAERAAVLTDALRNSKFFNTWGIPQVYLEDASKAMLETGASAYPTLREMLRDTRPALVWGSKQAMVSRHYQYRVCDYALFFLEKMQGGESLAMPVSPAERDAMIARLLK
jgi:hypothetical protein